MINRYFNNWLQFVDIWNRFWKYCIINNLCQLQIIQEIKLLSTYSYVWVSSRHLTMPLKKQQWIVFFVINWRRGIWLSLINQSRNEYSAVFTKSQSCARSLVPYGYVLYCTLLYTKLTRKLYIYVLHLKCYI